jgi:hypothetical protein
LRGNDKFPEFECGGDNFFAERRDVVLVNVADLLDETMGPFEQK